MQQLGASVFYTVVRWHKQGEVDSEHTLHISVVLPICVPKIIKCGGDLTKFWQKQVGSFLLAHPVYATTRMICTVCIAGRLCDVCMVYLYVCDVSGVQRDDAGRWSWSSRPIVLPSSICWWRTTSVAAQPEHGWGVCWPRQTYSESV